MSDYLTDAEWEEEIRCAALGMEGPNHKSVRFDLLVDAWDNRDKFKEADDDSAPDPRAA